MISLDHLWMLAAALVLDALIGDPDLIWRRIPHPVALIGGFVGGLDRLLNRGRFGPTMRRTLGAFVLLLVVLLAGEVGYGLEYLFALVPYGWIGTVVVAAILLAGRSLYDHVAVVARAFDKGGLAAARDAERMWPSSRIC